MAKKLQLIENSAGGIDLLTERDAGNEVLILTGKPSVSRQFYTDLRLKCTEALEALEGKKDRQKS